MFNEVAEICFTQKQYSHLVYLYEQKLIPHAIILNRFYQGKFLDLESSFDGVHQREYIYRNFKKEPNFKIGCALFENGSECFGQILLNLLSRGLRTESVKFIQFYEKDLFEMIQPDTVTDDSEWALIVDLIPDTDYKAKILIQLAIRDALFESHEAAKSDFDFYS